MSARSVWVIDKGLVTAGEVTGDDDGRLTVTISNGARTVTRRANRTWDTREAALAAALDDKLRAGR